MRKTYDVKVLKSNVIAINEFNGYLNPDTELSESKFALSVAPTDAKYEWYENMHGVKYLIVKCKFKREADELLRYIAIFPFERIK